jgi:hypothetical protein
MTSRILSLVELINIGVSGRGELKRETGTRRIDLPENTTQWIK